MTTALAPLRDFVTAFAALLARTDDVARIREEGAALLGTLVGTDGWLPDDYAVPDPVHYRQYLLHCDSLERFSVVSFVWAPGQQTPIHDHGIWGLVGVLRGAERVEPFVHDADGALGPHGPAHTLMAGEVDTFGPDIGDIHRVANAYDDRVSISIHVYGANIGAVERATYGLDGQRKRFISGYANSRLPNLWDRSNR